jgi:hypothetical protein
LAHIRIGYTVYVQICKDLQNLQLQTIQFYEYVYYAATNFGPKIAPSSGHNNTRKGIHIETETIKPEIARCTLKKKKYIYIVRQVKTVQKHKSPDDVSEITILVQNSFKNSY